jgi:hypothetical protein
MHSIAGNYSLPSFSQALPALEYPNLPVTRSSTFSVVYGLAARSGVESGMADTQIIQFGPGDPEDPKNWSTAKKVFALLSTCILAFAA